MPKKSKLQLKVQKTLLKKNCVTLLPDELNDSKLNNQSNKTNENDLKLVEYRECLITDHSVTQIIAKRCRGRPKSIKNNKIIRQNIVCQDESQVLLTEPNDSKLNSQNNKINFKLFKYSLIYYLTCYR
jgi:hypothetical protein